MEKIRLREGWWAGRHSSDPRPPSPELAVHRPPGLRGTEEVPARVSFLCVVEVQVALPFPCANIRSLSQRCLPHFWKQQGRQVSWKEARGEENSYWRWNQSGLPLMTVTASVSFAACTAEVSLWASELQGGKNLDIVALFSLTLPLLYNPFRKNRLLCFWTARLRLTVKAGLQKKSAVPFMWKPSLTIGNGGTLVHNSPVLWTRGHCGWMLQCRGRHGCFSPVRGNRSLVQAWRLP